MSKKNITPEMFAWWSDSENRNKLKRDIVRDMAAEGATQKEIATALGCTQHNVSMNYRKEYEEGRNVLKNSVRRWQILKARMGDTQLLMKVGQIYCEDQKDVREIAFEPGSLMSSIDRLMTCGTSVTSSETLSSIPMQDTISPLDQSDRENL